MPLWHCPCWHTYPWFYSGECQDLKGKTLRTSRCSTQILSIMETCVTRDCTKLNFWNGLSVQHENPPNHPPSGMGSIPSTLPSGSPLTFLASPLACGSAGCASAASGRFCCCAFGFFSSSFFWKTSWMNEKMLD